MEMKMERAELIFIPGPGMGHLVPAIEFGNLLTEQDERLSILFLIINLPYNTGIDTHSLSNFVKNDSRITFQDIPFINSIQESDPSTSKIRSVAAYKLIERSKPQVKEAISGILSKSNNTKIAGILVDMFCCSMIDLAHEFELPSYMFFTCSAGFLGLLLHIQTLKDDYNQDITDYKDRDDDEILVPFFKNPVPVKVLPSPMLEKNVCHETVLPLPRKIRETKGIIVNTLLELESDIIKSLLDHDRKIPKIYPIGPIINHKCEPDDGVMSWLDNQPQDSVIFLCFGSLGCFNEDQVKEIAIALELCGCRFLWSLRRPSDNKGDIAAPGAYSNPDEVLPKGFLKRTLGVGKVIGWAPQVEILGHPAVGGFVSHCGWNSILESLWFGVPIAAWPLSAEQQFNAFEIVKELGISVEIKMDYKHDVHMESKIIVNADEIEKGLKSLMMMDDEKKNEMRKKVKLLKEKCQKAMMEDGSSYNFLGHLIDDVMKNPPKLNQEK